MFEAIGATVVVALAVAAVVLFVCWMRARKEVHHPKGGVSQRSEREKAYDRMYGPGLNRENS